jgi:3-phosphoshikimate 1-carboxyvinyltransferase
MDVRVHPLHQPPAELSFQAAAPGAAAAPLSFAAPWLAAAAALSLRLYVRNVSLDPATLTFVDVLVRMGVRVREVVTHLQPGGGAGMLDVHPSRMRGITLPPNLAARLRQEIPLLAVLASLAAGTTTLRGAWLAENNRRLLCANLRTLQAEVEDTGDAFIIHGNRRLVGGELLTEGDPHLATAMVIAGLSADGDSLVRDVDAAAESQPEFFARFCAAQLPSPSRDGPPISSATDTRCCAGAVHIPLPG